MARIDAYTPSSLDQEQMRIYEAIAGGRRAQGPQLFSLVDADGALVGPFNAFLLSPDVSMPLQELGSAIRYRTRLTDRTREIAILLVARHVESEFEWFAHERIGKSVGITGAELTEIEQSGRLEPDDNCERAAVDLVVSILTTGDVNDEVFVFAQEQLGNAAIFELVTLVGYYRLLALQMKIFRSDASQQ